MKGNLQRLKEQSGTVEVRVALSCLPESLRSTVQGGREASKDDRVSMKTLHYWIHERTGQITGIFISPFLRCLLLCMQSWCEAGDETKGLRSGLQSPLLWGSRYHLTSQNQLQSSALGRSLSEEYWLRGSLVRVDSPFFYFSQEAKRKCVNAQCEWVKDGWERAPREAVKVNLDFLENPKILEIPEPWDPWE